MSAREKDLKELLEYYEQNLCHKIFKYELNNKINIEVIFYIEGLCHLLGIQHVYDNDKRYQESFVTISNKGEILINHMHISPYEKGNIFNKDPLRVRKLLLHKSEINKLAGQIKMKGYTLMPLKVYFKGSLVKVEIGFARGKKLYDKRQDIAKKDAKREAERDFKIRNLG